MVKASGTGQPDWTTPDDTGRHRTTPDDTGRHRIEITGLEIRAATTRSPRGLCTICYVFHRRWKACKLYVDLVFVDGDALDEALNIAPLSLQVEFAPALEETDPLGDNVGLGEVLDAHKVDFGREPWDLVVKLPGALFERPVELLESLAGNRVFQIEAVSFFHGAGEPCLLTGQLFKDRLTLGQFFVAFLQVAGHGLG